MATTATMGRPGRNPIVLLVDECPEFRAEVRSVLVEVETHARIAEAGTVMDAMGRALELRPDVAVVDVHLPDRSGIEFCRWATKTLPDMSTIIVSRFDREVYLAAARSAGAAGFVSKQSHIRDMVQAIRRTVVEGCFSPDQLARIREWHAAVGAQIRELTSRETDVLFLVVAGRTNRQIADDLGVSVSLVEDHIGSIVRKLGVDGREDLPSFILHRHGQ